MSLEIIVATTNRGKFTEISEVFKELPVKLSFLGELKDPPQVIEDQPTFEGNAKKKASEISKWSGKAVLADDSGLVVDVLEGRPGVYSARYAGEGSSDQENLEKVLSEVREIPQEKRGAVFICVMALVTPEGRELVVEGRYEGQIILEPRGSNGFGYDPIFLIPSLGKTAAELPLEEKNKVSHRGQALQKLKEILLVSFSSFS